MYFECWKGLKMFAPAAARNHAKEIKIEEPAKTHTYYRVKPQRSLAWLGITMVGLLMLYPFVAQYLPLGIRAYLSASLR